MKWKIAKMLVVPKKDGSISVKIFDQPMLGFQDSEKVGGIPNKNFPLVILAIIGKFNVSRILIDGGTSCHIMY